MDIVRAGLGQGKQPEAVDFCMVWDKKTSSETIETCVSANLYRGFEP